MRWISDCDYVDRYYKVIIYQLDILHEYRRPRGILGMDGIGWWLAV